ncbi:hypothetical protein [Ascidiimonas sp. W6]
MKKVKKTSGKKLGFKKWSISKLQNPYVVKGGLESGKTKTDQGGG